MAIDNYTDLKAAIANWLDREDLTARIPEFIELAEAGLNRELRVREMETVDSDTISSNQITLPSDWLAFRSLWVTQSSERYQLQQYTVEQVNSGYNTGTTMPYGFYVAGDTVYFYPDADASYTAYFIYYAKIPDLATNSTNWLLTSHPDVYLYASLLQAEPFLKNDVRVQTWSSLLGAAIGQLKEYDAADLLSGSMLQVRNY